MKNKTLTWTVSLLSLVISFMSCSKEKFNINRNPNDPTDSTITYDVILPAALEFSGSDASIQWGPIYRWMGYWARSGTYAPNVIEETYQITTQFGNGVWNNAYDNSYDYSIIQTKANAAGAAFYEGIARIMKAHNFQVLVDFYGNVPYFQALKGSANPTPVYDDGLTIYKDLLREIDAGIALIKGAVVTADNANKDIWKNDILFGDPVSGTIALVPSMKTRWAQFGNSLKLRLLIHAYARPEINKAAEIAIINAEGSGYLTEDAMTQPGYQADKPMPFHATYKTTAAGGVPVGSVFNKANEWGIKYYQANGDPRVVNTAYPAATPRLYEAGANGLVGVAYGLPPTNDNIATNLAGIGPGLYKTSSAAQILFSAAEAYFLRAEASERGFITSGPTAQQLTESGMLASFTYLGVPDPAAALTAYLNYNAGFPDVDYTAAPLAPGYPSGGITTILSQKWFALNGINALEVWTDYRRVPFSSVSTLPGASTTHFTYGTAGGYTPGPTISVAPQNTSQVIPIRYLYPQTEYNYNSKNVGAQGSINQFTSRIFWDMN